MSVRCELPRCKQGHERMRRGPDQRDGIRRHAPAAHTPLASWIRDTVQAETEQSRPQFSVENSARGMSKQRDALSS